MRPSAASIAETQIGPTRRSPGAGRAPCLAPATPALDRPQGLADLKLDRHPPKTSSPECLAGRAAARGGMGLTSARIDADECPATAAAGEEPCPPHPRRPRSGGRPSPTEALRCLQARSRSAQTKGCKRCKRNSDLAPWSKRMALTPATTDPCPTGLNARPESPCSLALSLAGKKKGFPASPRTLGVTDRGDRIRTCDLVLPKHPRYQAAPHPGGSDCSAHSASSP